MVKSLLIHSLMIGFVAGIVLYGISASSAVIAEKDGPNEKFCPAFEYEISKTVKMMVTAYSSTKDQTDDTPFTTASGKRVIEGIVANNMLPFGSKIRIPELYGDKIFVVEDRMHRRKGKYHVDIWFPEYKQAKNFGAKILEVEILES